MSDRKTIVLAALCLCAAGRPGPLAADDSASKKIYPETLHGTVWLLSKTASGTGWVADRERKLVVTCHHVVAGTDTIQVYFPLYKNGQVIADRAYYLENGRPVTGRVLDSDPKRDLAVIELPSLPPEANELKLAADSPATAGTVHTVGNPGRTHVPDGQTPDPLWKYTRGEVSSVFHQKDVREGGQVIDAMVVETQEPINPGDSGGPVVDDDGRLVAVNSGYQKAGNAVSYAIDVTEVKAFLAESLAYYHPATAADWRKRGAHYFARQRYEAAAEDFSAALRLEPGDAVTYRNRADCYRGRSLWERAIADYVQALRINPKDGYALRERGVCYASLEQYDQALDDLGQALQIASDDMRARFWRAMSLRGKGEIDKALAEFDDLVRDGPTNNRASYHYERAQAYVLQGKYDKAVEDLEAAVELAPKAVDAAFSLGQAYGKKGDVDKAIQSYDAALKLNPQYAPALVKRGEARLRKQDYDAAVADFDAALKLAETAEAFAGRGLANSRKRQYDRALADLGEALWRDPKDAASYRERAHVCLETGATAQALSDATEAIRLNPQDARLLAEAYNDRGVGYSQKGQSDKAIADFSKAIDGDPKNAVYYTNRAVSRFNGAELDQAVADCGKAIECDPKYAPAYLWRGRAFAKLGKEAESRKDLDTAVEIDPKLKQ